LDSIVEFADMQTRRAFDPDKRRSDRSLVESIQRNGLYVPIAIQPIGHARSGKYRVIHGHRRFAAGEQIGLETIPADVWDIEVSERVIDEATIEENTQREDLSPLELARMIKKYKDKHEVTQKEAGAVTGQSSANTSKLLSLLKLPDEVKDFINEYQIQASTAYKLAKLKDKERKAAMDAIRNKLPFEVAITDQEPVASDTNLVDRKKPGKAIDRKTRIERGYKAIRPMALFPTKDDLDGTKLKDLADREVIFLSQVKHGEKVAWESALPDIRRLPKPVLRDAGKALEQVLKVYSYSEFLNQEQMRILLKGIQISVEKLLQEVEST
jgi:ParB/RepB/Spo0J family partition protein